jgi:signal peptidase I
MAGYFAILLVILTLTSGLIWLLDALVLAPKRRERLVLAQSGAGNQLSGDTSDTMLKEPAIVETAKSIFPVIAAITLFRSFLFEPFQIPSGSMMPTLLVGDFILVEKFSYDVKDPVWRKTLYHNKLPERGDVAVFKYPEQPTVDFIKRIVGLPGDRIIYRDKQLYIDKACLAEQTSGCGSLERVTLTHIPDNQFFQGRMQQRRYDEALGENSHHILVTPGAREQPGQYYQQQDTAIDEFVVPEGQYFVLGDNRDNSRDSRFWGFVPADNLVGKAIFIWMSFEFSEDADSWLPGWVPVGVRFERLGKIE